ncbi:MAG: hypothetical protein Edafosvirus1_21 [Edafosvirus sp.]|uniref:Uncharacterized protein n=1 Tax=Edafosvirus sp. TaxID=2487765 RepID=A0A3G4ZS30_9VIRU|nr:MAG: hypothetical protein Edafosvirus1_21 [Edafosvirus sp.]
MSNISLFTGLPINICKLTGKPKEIFIPKPEFVKIICSAKFQFINLQLKRIIDAVNYLNMNPDIYRVEISFDTQDIKVDNIIFKLEQFINPRELISFDGVIGIASKKIWKKCNLQDPFKTLQKLCKEKYNYYMMMDYEDNLSHIRVYRYNKKIKMANYKITYLICEDNIPDLPNDTFTYEIPKIIEGEEIKKAHEICRKKHETITEQISQKFIQQINKTLIRMKKLGLSQYPFALRLKGVADRKKYIAYQNAYMANHWHVLGLKTPFELLNEEAGKQGAVIIENRNKKPRYILTTSTDKDADELPKEEQKEKKEDNSILLVYSLYNIEAPCPILKEKKTGSMRRKEIKKRVNGLLMKLDEKQRAELFSTYNQNIKKKSYWHELEKKILNLLQNSKEKSEDDKLEDFIQLAAVEHETRSKKIKKKKENHTEIHIHKNIEKHSRKVPTDFEEQGPSKKIKKN